MQYILGDFLFESSTVLPASVERDTQFEWVDQKRIGREPAGQFAGGGKDVFKLEGKVFPCRELGDEVDIIILRDMGKAGLPYWLLDGQGWIYGRWEITGIKEKRRELYPNSKPRLIEFSLDLKRYGEDADSWLWEWSV